MTSVMFLKSKPSALLRSTMPCQKPEKILLICSQIAVTFCRNSSFVSRRCLITDEELAPEKARFKEIADRMNAIAIQVNQTGNIDPEDMQEIRQGVEEISARLAEYQAKLERFFRGRVRCERCFARDLCHAARTDRHLPLDRHLQLFSSRPSATVFSRRSLRTSSSRHSTTSPASRRLSRPSPARSSALRRRPPSRLSPVCSRRHPSLPTTRSASAPHPDARAAPRGCLFAYPVGYVQDHAHTFLDNLFVI